jgi:hypothetical protein
MIRISYKPVSDPKFGNLPNTRDLVYTDFKDLPTLIEKGTLLRVEAAEFVPRSMPSAQPVPEAYDEQEAEAPVDVPAIDAQEVDLDNLTHVQTISAKEHASAGKIQSVYRQHLLKKPPSTESTLSSSRRAFFEQLAQEEYVVPVDKTLYRKMFLGPLAHALLCADHVQRWVYNSKRKAKKQLSLVKHQDLEDIRERQTKST